MNSKLRATIAALGITSVLVGLPIAVQALTPVQNSLTAYQCYRPDGVARTGIRLALPTQPSNECRAEDVLKKWTIANNAPVVTTTTATTTTPTTQPTTTTGATTTASTTTTTQPTGSYRNTVMADGPVAYWRFANTNSETPSHNGSLRGSPAPLLNQPGPFTGSQSIRFDGVLRDNSTTGGFLANSLGRLSSGTWSSGFTLEAWAKTTTSGPEQHVLTWSDSEGNAGPGILYDDPDNRWKYRDGSESISMNGSVSINVWYHVVATVDGSGNGKLYVNGAQVQTWNSGVEPASDDGLFTIGADYDSHDCPCPHVDTPFNGWIAEAAVYNKPLSAARVQAHFVAR